MTKRSGADVTPTSPRTVSSLLSEFLAAKKIRRVVIACSGGPDSVALALAASDLRSQLDAPPVLVHIDHALRGRESAGDRAFVVRLGEKIGLPVQVYQRPVQGKGGNLEENARDARYAALCAFARRVKGRVVLTAHSADDQAETVVMNMIRGCGIDGLGGMSPVRRDKLSGVRIARPFLGVERLALRSFLRARGQDFRHDSSNADDKFFRNYLRLNLFKELESRSPGFASRISRLAGLARDEQDTWDLLVDEAAKLTGRKHRGGWLLDRKKFEGISLGVQRRLLRRIVGNDLLTFDGLEKLRIWMESPPADGRFWQLRKNWIVERLSKTGGSPSSSLFWFHRSKDR